MAKSAIVLVLCHNVVQGDLLDPRAAVLDDLDKMKILLPHSLLHCVAHQGDMLERVKPSQMENLVIMGEYPLW